MPVERYSEEIALSQLRARSPSFSVSFLCYRALSVTRLSCKAYKTRTYHDIQLVSTLGGPLFVDDSRMTDSPLALKVPALTAVS